QKYLAGNYTLTASEVDQLGLRLAKNLSHRAVYGIDFEEDLPMEKAFLYAQQNKQGALVQGIMADVETQIKPRLSAGYMEKNAVRQILVDCNDPAMDELGHRFYMRMMLIGKGKEYVGTDVVSRWYDRNLRIATNIARLADRPGERILV